VAGPRQRLGFWYRFVAGILRPILMATTHRDWRGTEHLPGAGVGVVVSPNHISYADPLTFAHFLWDNGRAPRYLATPSLPSAPGSVSGSIPRGRSRGTRGCGPWPARPAPPGSRSRPAAR
jgi:1-acyl-sn-glycerol-3-phosphate acyltransferase